MKKNIFLSSIAFLLIAGSFLCLPEVALAQNPEQTTINNAVDKINVAYPDLVTAQKGEDASETTSRLVGNIIKNALGIIGTIALIVFLYSGIMWMLAGDNATALSDAKKSMIWAAIGLFAIFASYMLITYVIKAIAF